MINIFGVMVRNVATKQSLTMDNRYYVYMMTNDTNKALYTGVTNNLERRIYEHKEKLVKGFTEKYNIGKLVYYEVCEDINNAITREKEIKGWVRRKKTTLINANNPGWKDLSLEWEASPPQDPSLGSG